MAQMDDCVGALLKHMDDMGEADRRSRYLHHGQWRRSLHMAGWRHDALQSTKGTVGEGGFRVPSIVRWPGKIKAGSVENGLFSASIGFRHSSQPQGTRTSSTSCSRVSKSATAPTRTILTAIIRWISYWERRLQAPRTVLLRRSTFGAIRIDDFNFQFSSNLGAGLAKRSPPICPAWSIFVRIHLSGHQ